MVVDRSEFFREVTLRICGSLDIDRALAAAFEYVRGHVPADTMSLGYGDLDAALVRLVTMVKAADARYPWRDGAPEISLSDAELEELRNKPTDKPTVTVVNHPVDLPAMKLDLFPELARSSALFLRLDFHGEDVGYLILSAAGHGRYEPQHEHLMELVREPFAIAMSNARRYQELSRIKDRLADDNRALAADIKRAAGVEVVGADFGLRGVMEQVRQVAPSSSPTLLLGETGTGKEVIAHAIHMASPRARGPMISLQCGAVPETLLDSELFGHEKGAFTGATSKKRGRFERAHGGTLFLDEIGELSPEAQVKLLRVLQERRLERVGGTETIDVDVRVIAATHRDLEAMVRDGRFREDLWYRLNVLPIRIPPLRLRREDVPSLVQHFVERKVREMNLQRTPQISAQDLLRLQAYDWPGNVRELQNIVERALILSPGESLRFPDLAAPAVTPEAPASPGASPVVTLDQAVAAHIRATLDRTDGQVAGPRGAAELLEMNPSTLRFRIKKLDIRV